MRICAYVQEVYAKANYKRECFDTRQFVGMRVIIDCLERAGYTVEFAGRSTVHQYDIVLVSLTSDCDWWPYIRERLRWQRGGYKVLVGGAGVLHVAPFLRWFYAAMFGRGEDLIVPLVQSIEHGERFEHESVCYSDDFRYDRIYRLAQAVRPYPYQLRLSSNRTFTEGPIGCNHKCLFCGYSWGREFLSQYKQFVYSDSLFGNIDVKELALLDLAETPEIDWAHLRTTAIDGFSERLRVGVGKPITRSVLTSFLVRMLSFKGKPHQLKLYNICGYPTERDADWFEFLEDLRTVDAKAAPRDKQWSIVLHCTPFRAMPSTPMACAPMSKRNYRGLIGQTLGSGLRGNLIYQGRSVWAVESMGTDSLPAVMLSALAHRGDLADSENIARLCATDKFWRASSNVRESTLSKAFDMDRLFGRFTAETLPSRYLRTYLPVERSWGATPLEMEDGP